MKKVPIIDFSTAWKVFIRAKTPQDRLVAAKALNRATGLISDESPAKRPNRARG